MKLILMTAALAALLCVAGCPKEPGADAYQTGGTAQTLDGAGTAEGDTAAEGTE